MKKLIALILVFACLMPVIAVADLDLSGYSFDDLIDLQRQITAEILSRPEWKEVTVPAGDWVVGTDIPAGSYGIRNDSSTVNLSVWKREVNDYTDNGLLYNELIRKGGTFGKIILKDGWIVSIGSPLVFTPPLSLGF